MLSVEFCQALSFGLEFFRSFFYLLFERFGERFQFLLCAHSLRDVVNDGKEQFLAMNADGTGVHFDVDGLGICATMLEVKNILVVSANTGISASVSLVQVY